MSDPQITCTKCGTEIKLTESLAAPLIVAAREQFEAQLAAKESEFSRREAQLQQTKAELAKTRETVDEQIAARMAVERTVIAEAEAKRARLALADDLCRRDQQLADLQHLLAANDAKLAEAQQAQAEMLRKQRELDVAKREVELTIEKKVQENLVAVRDKARLEAEDALKAKVAEKEAQLAGMQRQIEDLRRKAGQGSQQLQGESLEAELESLLRARFHGDLIEPVPKGEFGGDVVHGVVSASGQRCGTILWELKRTKAWNPAWLSKLRDDQRAAKAELALIVSTVLPKDVEGFDLVENVWVAGPRFAIPLAVALRQLLIDVATSRQAQEGQQTKTEIVYSYLTGPRFRHRIEAIVEKFTDMQKDLDRKRATMSRLWAKREEQLRGVLESTAGLYGDIQGIAGRAMQEIESLDVLMIESRGEAAE
ncbi:DUF2130 domain-containing protein [Bradyrhizobium guangzhouense]|uniref:DUF2130 domain-containing protein n=1 Tax=Bradyrhizobium guangzhouense TaxID=1325095 RepID=A0AAE5WWF5_9BRAD|nr:DUF2130 domain-containing protein [Bradyrhizobium guangzhouense]QAU44344.1 DUF2130 domain-containing protein [Bradyrhizobium guangzhouense]RXH10086.1 DUF2130 domain-containing protein [Bradyrhizobium guangzhouense]